jgi:nucleotide-binding universal stress UspA family protein
VWVDDEGNPMRTPAVVRNRLNEEAAARSRSILDKAKSAASAAGVVCRGISVAGHAPYEVIIRQAKRHGCDLILMASHGRRGLSALLIGSETAKVLAHSKIPVLVVR